MSVYFTQLLYFYGYGPFVFNPISDQLVERQVTFGSIVTSPDCNQHQAQVCCAAVLHLRVQVHISSAGLIVTDKQGMNEWSTF